MRGLESKRVVVTGGASGIGTATVRRFLAEGSRVVVIDRDVEGNEALAESLPELAGVVSADVSDPDEVACAFVKVDDLLQGLDVLVNNAGISIRHAFMDITPDECH